MKPNFHSLCVFTDMLKGKRKYQKVFLHGHVTTEASILQIDAVKVYVPCKPTRPWGYRVNKLNNHDLESFLEMTKTSMIDFTSLPILDQTSGQSTKKIFSLY